MAYYYSKQVLNGSRDSEISQDKIKSILREFRVDVAETVIFCGEPRVYFTRMSENIMPDDISEEDFFDCITIGDGTYIDSSLEPAFPSCVTKLTSVKRSNASAGKISLGRNVVLQGTCIVSYEEVKIGDNVICGGMVTIMDCDGHDIVRRGDPDEVNRLIVKPVRIGDSVWIGNNVTILKGVTIDDNAVIGANSVVTQDIPSNVVVAGNPAKIIKTI